MGESNGSPKESSSVKGRIPTQSMGMTNFLLSCLSEQKD